MEAREVTSFIYSHKLILAFIRKETGGKELVRPGLTQSVSAFLTLQRLYTHKQSLKAWFVSEKWTQNPLSRKSSGQRASNLVVSKRWVEQCNQPLHGAGYFLNPGYYYDRKEVECDYEAAFLACVEIMTRSPNEEDEILTEVDSYKNAKDLFGKGSAIRLRSKKQP
ncbi:hypothetical protein RJ640_014344, partial [Escallonia rubra]